MKPSRQEMEDAINELRSAILENMDLDIADEKIKLKRIKAHSRLMRAKDIIRDLTINK